MKNWREVDGWIHDDEFSILQELSKGKDCLEIGSYKGKSAIILSEFAKSVTCVDTFAADGSGQNQESIRTTFNDFMENTKDCDNVFPCIGESKEIIPLFNDDKFDFIFVDGLHSYQGVKTDILICWPKLKMGGVMAFHDYGWDGFKDGGPRKAVDEFFKNPIGQFFSIVYVIKDKETL
jgi:predicted O-methyltransferase YrrM